MTAASRQPAAVARLLLALAAALALALGAAACARQAPGSEGVASLSGGAGGESDPQQQAGGEEEQDPQERALAFAKCMREHGVDMPDPEFGADGSLRMRLGGPGTGKVDREQLDQAMEACRSLAPSGGGGKRPKHDPEVQKLLLAFAKCMREHGIENFPDPGADGGLILRAGEESGINPDSPEFKAAEEACRSYQDRIRERVGPPHRQARGTPGGGERS